MKPDELSNTGPVRLAGLAGIALVASTLTAFAVIFALGARFRHRDKQIEQANIEAERIPIQPAVSTSTPPGVPDHFTEDLLVPGLTYTGPEVVQQDNQVGRSPEGV